MGQLIRTITFGLNIYPEAPTHSAARIERLLSRCPELLEEHGLESRCLRLTCQPPHSMYQSTDAPVRAQAFARAIEEIIAGRAWFCLPGPHYRTAAMPTSALDAIPAVLSATQNVFTHTLVSSPSGVHRGAIRKAGEVIAALARLDDRCQANFRFAVIANVQPGTPYFPAAYHDGADGFSIALELSALMNQCFLEGKLFNGKLREFEKQAEPYVRQVLNFAERLEAAEGLEFKGIDFSLAPFPGDGTSAVQAVESLNNTRIGNYEFLFSLYAVNNLLRQGFAHCPQVGYNGTMLSPLEDSCLAQRLSDEAFDLKDLLLYACVCGCGLDMVPLPLETSPAKLASLIEPVAAQASKWNKPLTVRLLPTTVNADGMTHFEHDFLVNCKPLRLKNSDFADQIDVHSFFAPAISGAEPGSDELSYLPQMFQASRAG